MSNYIRNIKLEVVLFILFIHIHMYMQASRYPTYCTKQLKNLLPTQKQVEFSNVYLQKSCNMFAYRIILRNSLNVLCHIVQFSFNHCPYKRDIYSLVHRVRKCLQLAI